VALEQKVSEAPPVAAALHVIAADKEQNAAQQMMDSEDLGDLRVSKAVCFEMEGENSLDKSSCPCHQVRRQGLFLPWYS